MLVDEGTEVQTGELAQVGSLACVQCGYSISLELSDELPGCPACGGTQLPPRLDVRVAHGRRGRDLGGAPLPAWLDEIRETLKAGEQFVAFADGDDPVVTELQDGWTRIGRSGSADIQLDDATVSRRHALIVRTREDELRALDDRSLNGLFINGERVEWAPLIDGDELEIGRYRLYVIQT